MSKFVLIDFLLQNKVGQSQNFTEGTDSSHHTFGEDHHSTHGKQNFSNNFAINNNNILQDASLATSQATRGEDETTFGRIFNDLTRGEDDNIFAENNILANENHDTNLKITFVSKLGEERDINFTHRPLGFTFRSCDTVDGVKLGAQISRVTTDDKNFFGLRHQDKGWVVKKVGKIDVTPTMRMKEIADLIARPPKISLSAPKIPRKSTKIFQKKWKKLLKNH